MSSSPNNKLQQFLKSYNVLIAIAFLFLVLIAIFSFWLQREEYYTERFIGQKYLPLLRKKTVPPLIIEGITQDKVNVLYGTVLEKEYIDTLDARYIKDVFTDKWYLTFVDESRRFDSILINTLSIRIDGKVSDIDLNNNEEYAILTQPLHFAKPNYKELTYSDINTVLPLPQIPTKTLDLTMSGTITDVDGKVYPFSYSADGILWEDEHDWGSVL